MIVHTNHPGYGRRILWGMGRTAGFCTQDSLAKLWARREQELITSRAATTRTWLQHVPMENNLYYSKKFTGTTLLCFFRTTILGRKECAMPWSGHPEKQRSGLDGYRSTYGKNQWRTPWTICRCRCFASGWKKYPEILATGRCSDTPVSTQNYEIFMPAKHARNARIPSNSTVVVNVNGMQTWRSWLGLAAELMMLGAALHVCANFTLDIRY